MDKELTITITVKEADVIMTGLMELQGKIMIPVMQKLDSQIRPQLEEQNG